jgi:hypothetical protein
MWVLLEILTKLVSRCPPYKAPDHGQVDRSSSVMAGEHVIITCSNGYQEEGWGDGLKRAPMCTDDGKSIWTIQLIAFVL